VQFPDVCDADHKGSVDELERLATTLGYRCVGRLSQRRSSNRGSTVLGEGALKQLAEWTGGAGVVKSRAFRKVTKAALKGAAHAKEERPTEENDPDEPGDKGLESHATPPKEKAQVVIFDCELTPSQLRNLESATGATVLDRTGVVIGIFSRHAKTREAKIQVELASLAYLSPRLRETGGQDRQGGGIGAKGAGETALELDRRKIRDRVKELRGELDGVRVEQATRRTRRAQEPTVALVGYTNAGKSSLMRALTGSDVLIADQLFATLDTTVRPMKPESRPRVLVTDTVGFIKQLPHDLVASFRSTLDEACDASLQLLLVDAADPAFRAQLLVVETVLREVGAGDVPRLLVLNKRDLLSPLDIAILCHEFPNAFPLCTRDARDLATLREKIDAFFAKGLVETELSAPYTATGFIGEIHAHTKVLSETYEESRVRFKIQASKEVLDRLRRKFGNMGMEEKK
jgi:GTP-binding protein HflX